MHTGHAIAWPVVVQFSAGSRGQTRTIDIGLGQVLLFRQQVEVELDGIEGRIDFMLADLGRIGDVLQFRHQPFAGGEGKVVIDQRIAFDVDLRGQLAIARYR